jgi:hypothetical protein
VDLEDQEVADVDLEVVEEVPVDQEVVVVDQEVVVVDQKDVVADQKVADVDLKENVEENEDLKENVEKVQKERRAKKVQKERRAKRVERRVERRVKKDRKVERRERKEVKKEKDPKAKDLMDLEMMNPVLVIKDQDLTMVMENLHQEMAKVVTKVETETVEMAMVTKVAITV